MSFRDRRFKRRTDLITGTLETPSADSTQVASPPLTTAVFDGRASRLTQLWGYTRYVSNGPLQGGNVPDVYNSFCFWDGDITLLTDSRFTKVFDTRLNQDSRNPNWSGQPSNNPSTELVIKDRTLNVGQIDWYAMSTKIIGTYRTGSWGVNFQFGYPTLTSPPIAIAIDNEGVGIDRHAGIVTTVGSNTGLLNVEPRWFTVAEVQDVWVDWLVGVKWSVSNDGWVRVENRVGGPGNQWVVNYSATSTNTYQQQSGQPWKTLVQDKMGAYLLSTGFPSTWENRILHSGHTRWADEYSARAVLG